MHFLVYLVTGLLVFYPAVGFVFLKSTSAQTRREKSVRFSLFLLFVLQIATFLSITVILLTDNEPENGRVRLFSFLALYAVDLIAMMIVFILPESCQTDRIIESLLHLYIVLFIFLFIAGLFLSPVLGNLMHI